jgi:hypothetical protein
MREPQPRSADLALRAIQRVEHASGSPLTREGATDLPRREPHCRSHRHARSVGISYLPVCQLAPDPPPANDCIRRPNPPRAGDRNGDLILSRSRPIRAGERRKVPMVAPSMHIPPRGAAYKCARIERRSPGERVSDPAQPRGGLDPHIDIASGGGCSSEHPAGNVWLADHADSEHHAGSGMPCRPGPSARSRSRT